MHKGKKFRTGTKYEQKTRRKERIHNRNQGLWFDKESGKKPGTTQKRWKKQGHWNKYGRAY